LIEKNLIESFVINQVKNGISEFKLEAFLGTPEVANLPLALDLERLGDVLDVLSKVSKEIQLDETLSRHLSESQLKQSEAVLEREKEAEIERIEQEMSEIIGKLPPADVTRMLKQLNQEIESKKAKITQIYDDKIKAQKDFSKKAKEILEDRKRTLSQRLKKEIVEELKDFDQMLADREKAKQEEEDQRKKAERLRVEEEDRERERKKVWRKRLILGGTALGILGGLWGWNLVLEERDRLERLAEQERDRGRLEQEIAQREIERVRLEQERLRLIEFILIKGGSFMMGSEESNWEKPIHRVVVKDFYMSKTEVTVGQYRKCVEAGVCSKPDSCNYGSPNWTDSIGSKENHPINCVDWKQARTFAKWVGGDLPSEAQWEYASRSGGKDIKYPWGNAEATCEYAEAVEIAHGKCVVRQGVTLHKDCVTWGVMCGSGC
jgi:formylglycine-generating enzyme required for sulfatase activity